MKAHTLPDLGHSEKDFWTYCTDICKTWCTKFNQVCRSQACGYLYNWEQRVEVTLRHLEYLYIFLLISLQPLACGGFVIIAASQQVRQWHREEGKIHGDTLGDAVRRWESVLRNQREREHIDRVPSGKSLLLALGSYRRRGGGRALEEDSNYFQDTTKLDQM